MGRKTTTVALALALLATLLGGLLAPSPAGADGTTAVPVTCSGIPIVGTTSTNADVEAVDSVDPVAPGGAVTNTVRVPVPIEDVPLDVTISEVKVTFPVPFNVVVTGVTFTPSSFSSQTYAVSGSNVVVTLAGSVALGPGKPVPTVPEIKVATTVNGFPRTLSWKVPSSIVAKGNAGFLGNVTATCTPNDPNQVLITTTVANPNRPPVATDATVPVLVDTPTAITLKGTDPDLDPLTYAVATQPAHGDLTGTPPALTYTPDQGYVGPDSFTFTASDGSLSDTGTIALDVEQTPPSVPGAPATVATPAPRDGAAIVSWTAPTDDGGAPVTGYRITPVRGQTALAPVTVGPDVLRTTIGQLQNGSAHTFRVAALNQAGAGPEATSAAVTPRPWSPFASADDAVTKLHQWIVGRAPTAAEKATWVPKVTTGGSAQMGLLVVALRGSADNRSHVDPVARLYRAFFLRTPDVAGTTHWIGRKRAGTSLPTIARAFAGSKEFEDRYGPVTNQQFVQLVYQNVLGRAPDAAGLAHWTKELETGKRDRGTVMVGFSESAEYRAKQLHPTNAAVFWVLVNRRTPKADEIAATVQDLGALAPALVYQAMLRGWDVGARL